MERVSQSSIKRQKTTDGKENMPLIDRLSALPDDVLCQILSFLPTKLSVATSILSKRWSFLWAHVPNLDFDSGNHDSRMRFSSIMKKVILPHKTQSITSFRLCSREFNFPEYDLEIWIATAIERNVRNIYLDLGLIDSLPQSLFNCKTLVDLRLHDCVHIPSSGPVYLPSLKNLRLSSIEYEADGALAHLLSGCPVLEELMVDRIVDRHLSCSYIVSPTIKRLTIEFPFDNSNLYNPYDNVKINTPALRYLKVYECSYDHISLSPMTSLDEADICFDIYMLQVDYDFYMHCVLKFIDSLCNVKYLKLSGGSEEFLDLGVAGPYVRFDNLIRLELTADWRFIPKFIESADNLEVLIIHEVDEDIKIWMEPTDERCACLLSSLRTITIDQFGCTEDEFELIGYLLRNAQVLERMEIYCQDDGGISLEEKLDALQRILLFRRGSSECEVAFS